MLKPIHLHAQIIGRSGGQSAVKAAAYRSGQKLELVDGTTVDYGRKRGVIHSRIIHPTGGVCDPLLDRGELWRTVEVVDHRKNSQFAREMDLALPLEISEEARLAIADKFARWIADRWGVAVDLAVHDPTGQNPHCHVMITTRQMTPAGLGKKVREMNTKNALREIREAYTQTLNEALQRGGIEGTEYTAKSYKDLGIDRRPQVHMGKNAAALERRGIRTIFGDFNKQIAAEAARLAAVGRGEEHPPSQKEKSQQTQAAQTPSDVEQQLLQQPGQSREEIRRGVVAEGLKLVVAGTGVMATVEGYLEPPDESGQWWYIDSVDAQGRVNRVTEIPASRFDRNGVVALQQYLADDQKIRISLRKTGPAVIEPVIGREKEGLHLE